MNDGKNAKGFGRQAVRRYRPNRRFFAIVAILLVAAMAWPVVHHFRASTVRPGAAGDSAPASAAAPSEAVVGAGPAQAAPSADVAAAGFAARRWIATPFGRVQPALAVPVPLRDSARLKDGTAPPADAFDTSLLHSRAAILIDATTGAILAEKDQDEPLPPASLTKLMTLDIAFEDIESGRHKPGDTFPVSVKAWRTGGSRMFIDPSMRVRLQDLLYGIAVDSGNDAALAVAEGMAGSEGAFVDRMNAHASALGMTHTHFENTNGLPATGHLSSAADLARLARHYLDAHPEALLFHATRQYTFKGITQWNQNPLLIHDYPGADGLKTGFASDCFNLAGTARRGDTRLLVVTLCAPTESARNQDAQNLLDWGFAEYRTAVPVAAGQDLRAVPVTSGVDDRVGVRVASALAVTVPAKMSADAPGGLQLALDLPRSLTAPLSAGQVVGTVKVIMGGKVVASAPAVAAAPVARLGAMAGLRQAHPAGVWILFAALAATALAGVLGLDRLRRRRRLTRLLRGLPRLRFGDRWGGGDE